MPLVEVIAPEGSDPAAVNTVFAFTRKLGKTPVLVKDTPGFLVNRLLMFYSTEALWLLDEGYRIEDLDRAMADWGMPMGPMALTDEVGIDVATKVAHILHDAFSDRLPLPEWLDQRAAERPAGHEERQGVLSLRGARAEGAGPGDLRPPRPPAPGGGSRPRPDRRPHGAADGQRGGPLPGGRGGAQRRRARPRADLRHRLPALPRRPLPLGGPGGVWAGSWPPWSAWKAPWATASRLRTPCARRRRRGGSMRGSLGGRVTEVFFLPLQGEARRGPAPDKERSRGLRKAPLLASPRSGWRKYGLADMQAPKRTPSETPPVPTR